MIYVDFDSIFDGAELAVPTGKAEKWVRASARSSFASFATATVVGLSVLIAPFSYRDAPSAESAGVVSVRGARGRAILKSVVPIAAADAVPAYSELNDAQGEWLGDGLYEVAED